MKALTTIVIVLLFQMSAFSQTKVYFSAGRSVSNLISISDFYVFGTGLQVKATENGYDTKGLSNFFSGEFLVENRLNKVISGVTGVSVFKIGYDNSATFSDPTIGDFHSKLDVTSLGIPLLFRANLVNAVMFDLGFVVSVPISAKLNETRNIGTVYEESHSGRITSSLVSNYLGGFGGYLGFTILINRYTITASWQASQIVVDDSLKDSWPLGDGSMFLEDMHPKFSYEIIYLKLGIRIK